MENLEPVKKEAELTEKAASDAAELPRSTTEEAPTTHNPLEKEREVARKREQERRRREAVSGSGGLRLVNGR